MTGRGAAVRWDAAAHGPCPAPEDLLLAAAELVGDVDVARAAATLDEQARPLFGTSGRVACATRLTTAMELDLGYRVVHDETPETLSLTRVLETRVGHPLVLAVITVALLRRAGHPGTVCFADGRWIAAASGSPLLVLDSAPGERPEQVRPVCGHLVGYAALAALRRAHEREGDDDAALAYERLLDDLPVAAPPA